MRHIVLLALLASSPHPLIAEDWSLEKALERGLATRPEVTSGRERLVQSQMDSRKVWSDWLPSVSLSKSFEQERRRYDSGLTRTEKRTPARLAVEERIDAPLLMGNKNRRAKNTMTMAAGSLVEERQSIRSRIEKSYFRVKAADRYVAFAERNVRLAEESAQDSDKRYRSGFVDRTEFQRSQLLLEQAKVTLAEREQQRRSEMIVLKDLLSLPSEASMTLTSPLPTAFSYFDQSAEELLQRVDAKKSQKVANLELALENAEIDVRDASLAFLPDLFAGASYEVLRPNEQPYEQVEEPRLYVGLEWEIFSGGKSYYGYRRAVSAREWSRQQLQLAKRDQNVVGRQRVERLKWLQRSYAEQEKTVASWQEIVQASRRQFSLGTASSKQVSDDFESYLAEQARLLDLSLEIVGIVSDLGVLTSDASLFREWTGVR